MTGTVSGAAGAATVSVWKYALKRSGQKSQVALRMKGVS